MKRPLKLIKLSAEEWKFLLGSLFLLPLVGLMLNRFGYRETRYRLLRRSKMPSSLSAFEQIETARYISRMVDAAANHGFYKATCLKRSLALAWFLSRSGISSDIRIGARSSTWRHEEKPQFSAHAWLEVHKVVINDQGDVEDRFVPFDRRVSGNV